MQFQQSITPLNSGQPNLWQCKIYDTTLFFNFVIFQVSFAGNQLLSVQKTRAVTMKKNHDIESYFSTIHNDFVSMPNIFLL